MTRKSFAVLLVSGFVAGVQASFVWNTADSGDWLSPNRWSGGAVPSYVSGESVYLTNTAAAYCVGLSNTTGQVIWGLNMLGADADGYPTSLSLGNADLKVAGGSIAMTNSEIRVGTGSTLEITDAVVWIRDASRIVVDGGTLVATNSFKEFFVRTSVYKSNGNPELTVLSGDVFFKYISSLKGGISLQGIDYGRITMEGGTMTFDSDMTKGTATVLMLNGNNAASSTMELSGNSVLHINRGGCTFGEGVVTVKDNASISFAGNDVDHFAIQPYYSTSKKMVTVNLTDNSSVQVGTAKFYLGKTDARTIGTVGNLNISGGTHSFGRYSYLGCGHGTFTTTISGGFTEFRRYGLKIGSYPPVLSNNGAANAKPYACTGTVDVTGGVLSLDPEEAFNTSARKGLWGTTVGYGEESSVSGWFDGRLNISGNGIVTNAAGPLIVGAGKAVGSVVQTGGAFRSVIGGTTAYSRRINALVLGICGGRGSYSISGGTAEYKNEVYVGGIGLWVLNRGDAQDGMPANDGSSAGLLEVTGGSFSASRSVCVGALGTGTVHVASGGSLSVAQDLILSNSVPGSATLKLVLEGDAAPSVTVGGDLVVRDGAKLEVDVSGFTSREKWTRLVSCSSRVGTFVSENVTVVGNEVHGSVVFDRSGDDTGSIWWYRPRGTAVLVR